MIIVTVTLVPGGYEPHRREIGMLRISNITDLTKISIDVAEAANPLTGSRARVGRCVIERHDRIQSVWALVEQAAAAAQNANLADL